MGAELGHNRYGKSGIRVATVRRSGDRHDFSDWTVDMRLEGAFLAAHAEGDNTEVLPTDTMRGATYALAKEHPGLEIEEFGLLLTEYLLGAAPAATLAEVSVEEQPWERIEAGGEPHPHAFTRAAYRRTARVTRTREDADVSAGVTDLVLLKTTDSAFRGFLKDRYTTLPETDDRILATNMTAEWRYAEIGLDYRKVADEVRRVVMETFAGHDSDSVQHTLYAMGESVLEACPDVKEIRFTLPNLHHIAVDLAPYGLENPGEVFVATDRPYGVIEGTVVRRTRDSR
jgi:urate oxidase